MCIRTLYYLGKTGNRNFPELIRKQNTDEWIDENTKESIEFKDSDIVRSGYIKLTPYINASIVRFLNNSIIDSLYLILSFETTDRMVNIQQTSYEINLLSTFMQYITKIADANIINYIPKSISESYVNYLGSYAKIERDLEMHLYRNDYVDQVMELLDIYGINNLRKEFERYIDIDKIHIDHVLTDKEYRNAIYEALKFVFAEKFKIYELSDIYIKELIEITKNSNLELALPQQQALCQLDIATHPLLSYPIDTVFETTIIYNTLMIFPFNHTIDIDKLKKYNPLYNLIIVRSKESEAVYVVIYREKSILTTSNPNITGFTEEEMDKIRKSIAS